MKRLSNLIIFFGVLLVGGCALHFERLNFRAEHHVDNIRATEDIVRYVEYKQPF